MTLQSSGNTIDDKLKFCFGETRREYFEGPLVHRRFESVVHSGLGSRTCLVNDEGRLTYQQVDSLATALAKRLIARGIKHGSVVGVLLDRSFDVVISLLATLKAGGCYVPLDPQFPADRLSIYVEDSGATCIITQTSLSSLAYKLSQSCLTQPAVVQVHDVADEASSSRAVLPSPAQDDEDALCYCMFTSGSTGRPKGVQISHRGLRDLICFFIEKMQLTSNDTFCLNTTICFDSYVLYLYSSLVLGAKLVVPHPEAHLDPHYMAELVHRHGISILEAVPSLASEYVAAFEEACKAGRLSTLTRFLTGGEALNPSLVKKIVTAVPHLKSGTTSTIYNTYGPTEVTVQVFTGACRPPFDKITLGRPDYNVHAYVVTPNGNGTVHLCGVGEPGELYLSGPRVGKGYRGRDDLTGAVFVDNPFFDQAMQLSGLDASMHSHYSKCYRTGDLVQWAADGELEFLGRIDHQVKINGVRMELTEIEAALTSAPGVSIAAVKAWKNQNGEYRLAGYVASDQTTSDAVINHCRSVLLPAMVPSVVIVSKSLARLPNGKVDAKALPEPAWDEGNEDESIVLPSTETEHMLARVWCQALDLKEDSFNVDAHFFNRLGGTSLKAGVINSAIRRITGIDISGVVIYQNPTVRRMAAALDDIKATQVHCSSDTETSMTPSECKHDIGSDYNSSEEGNGDVPVSAKDVTGFPIWVATILQFFGLVLSHIGTLITFLTPPFILIAVYVYTAAPEYVLPLVVPVALFVSHTLLLLLSIISKWVLLGRQKPGSAPLWGGRYIAWWTVRAIDKQVAGNVLPFIKGTQFHTWYLRALGAKIGRGVVLDTFHISDHDLIEIGDNTILGSNTLVQGAAIVAGANSNDPGRIHFDRIVVGKECSIGCMSTVGPGTVLEDGSVVVPSSALPGDQGKCSLDLDGGDINTEDGQLPLALSILAYVVLLIVESIVWILQILPSLVLWISLNRPLGAVDMLASALDFWTSRSGTGLFTTAGFKLWWTECISILLLPIATFLVNLLYMWLLVPAKWILVGRITPEKLSGKKGLTWRFRSHVWKVLIEDLSHAQIAYLFTATEVFNVWLRSLGARVGKQAWLSEKLRCAEPDLLRIGDFVSICSDVGVHAATLKKAAHIKLHPGCDVTNNSTLSPGVVVHSGAVLGLMTYAKPGQVYPPNSITLNQFCLVPGDDIESGVKMEELEKAGAARAAEQREITTWQYVRYNIIYNLMTLIIYPLADISQLPFVVAMFSALYFSGLWFAVVTLPVSVFIGYTCVISYFTLTKKILLPKSSGEHPLFLSLKTISWQQLCILSSYFDDFMELMGSQFYVWFLRLNGTKVGSGVCCYAYLTEHDQVTIGSGAVVNEAAYFLTHTVENRKVKVCPVTIEARTTMGLSSAALPNSVMRAGARLGAGSVLMKGETVPGGSFWSGIPAIPSKPTKY